MQRYYSMCSQRRYHKTIWDMYSIGASLILYDCCDIMSMSQSLRIDKLAWSCMSLHEVELLQIDGVALTV